MYKYKTYFWYFVAMQYMYMYYRSYPWIMHSLILLTDNGTALAVGLNYSSSTQIWLNLKEQSAKAKLLSSVIFIVRIYL